MLWRWLPLLIMALRRRTRETVAEMRKVLWPSRKEMTTYTVVVIIFVVVMVSLVAGLDLGFAKLILAVFG
jgi:preprotein translocase subunit SecE